MTSTMNIVRLFECEQPEIAWQFEGYRHIIKRRLSSQEVENCKYLVERYIIKHLSKYLCNYKLYSYKFFDSVRVEIFLKPAETASIMEYYLTVGPDKLELERIR